MFKCCCSSYKYYENILELFWQRFVIKNIYLISDSSKFSSFFAESSGSSAGGGGGDDEFEEKFSYSKQVEYYNKQHEISLGKRKRFIIDANKRDYVKKSTSFVIHFNW